MEKLGIQHLHLCESLLYLTAAKPESSAQTEVPGARRMADQWLEKYLAISILSSLKTVKYAWFTDRNTNGNK